MRRRSRSRWWSSRGRRPSRRRRRTEGLTILRAAAAGLAACLASATASGQELRAGKSELSLSPVFTLGKTYRFPVDASAKTVSGFGLGVQWHYNFDGHWSAGLDAEFRGADYTGTAVPSAPSATPAFSFDADISTSTLR